MKGALLAGLVVLSLGACASGGADPVAQRSASPSPTIVTIEQGGRVRMGPAGIGLVFETSRLEEKLFQRAIRDLVKVKVWKKLTKGLYSIEMETHPGARSKAGVHLADAVLNHTLVDNQPKVVCDIRFYPRAIRQELRIWARIRELGITPRRWRDYNSNKVFDETTPSKNDFWAAILAHEIAHCLVGPHGEKAAQAWEYKTMKRLS